MTAPRRRRGVPPAGGPLDAAPPSSGLPQASSADPSEPGVTGEPEHPRDRARSRRRRSSAGTLPAHVLDGRDPNTLAYFEDAFPSYAPSRDYEKVRRILGEAPRHKRSTGPRRYNPLLPPMRCGAPTQNGKQCGRTILAGPVQGYRKPYRYVSSDCSEAGDGHQTTASPYIEDAVLAMVAEAYEPSAMIRAIGNVQLRLTSAQDERRTLQAKIDRLLVELEQAEDAELSARADQRMEDVDDYVGMRRRLKGRVAELEARQAQLFTEFDGAATQADLRKRLAIIRSLAGDVQRLLAESRPYRNLTAAIVRALTRRISIRQVASHFVVVEIQFPNGAQSRRLILTGRLSCTQPERALALQGLLAGMSPDAIVAQFHAWSSGQARVRLIRPFEVLSFALAHRFLETETPRAGPHVTVPALADRVGASEQQVWGAVLGAKLGPLCVGEDGVGAVAPTEAELEREYPAYALREVETSLTARGIASTTGIVGRVVSHEALAAEYRLKPSVILRAWGDGAADAPRDAVGRVYLDRQALPARVAQALDRALARQAREGTFEDARRRVVLAAGYDSASAEDFLGIPDLSLVLRTGSGTGAERSLYAGLRAGHLVGVPYHGPRPKPGGPAPQILVYLPPVIRTSKDPEAVRQWLRGDTQLPPPRLPIGAAEAAAAPTHEGPVGGASARVGRRRNGRQGDQ